MKKNNKKISLLFFTAVFITAGCAGLLREKSQCEKVCEQMHSECNLSCPADIFDPTCHERCDSYRDCRETCDKPLFREGESAEGDNNEK